MSKQIVFLALMLFFTYSSAGCFLKSDQQLSAEAEERIGRSEALRKLDGLCTGLPFFSGLRPIRKSFTKGKWLNYEYRLDKDFNDLKAFCRNKLLSEGWALMEDKGLAAGYVVEFEKGDLGIFIFYGPSGDAIYSVSCRDESLK